VVARMNTIAIIPARGGSKALPRKNVLPLCGKPLISWAIEAAHKAAAIDKVFVSTDDVEIAAVSEQAGASVMCRPTKLASDTASSESALIHGLLEIGKLKFRDGGKGISWQEDDILVFLQCTSPLTTGADIDAVVERLISEKADSAFSVTDFHYFLWKRGQGGAEAVNHDKSFRPRRQDREPQFVENGAVYAMRIPGFLEAEHRFFGKTVFHSMPPERCWEIDDPVDFEIAEILMRKRMQSERTKLLPDQISAVVFDFDGVLTDDRVLTNEDRSEAVFCTRKDGMGIRLLQEAGFPVLILSSEENPVVRARAAKLKVDVIHGSLDKAPLLQEWAAKQNIDLGATVYVGNDTNDIGPMNIVGCPIAVADSHPAVKRHAMIVLEQCGGFGAARELSDLILASAARRKANQLSCGCSISG
jgi:YrbI family 3-deoxy-D-manno-octulosonate 8-phosphate phosphatase